MSIELILNDIDNIIKEIKYQELCLKYSKSYIEGCSWYIYINKYGDGSYVKAYNNILNSRAIFYLLNKKV